MMRKYKNDLEEYYYLHDRIFFALCNRRHTVENHPDLMEGNYLEGLTFAEKFLEQFYKIKKEEDYINEVYEDRPVHINKGLEVYYDKSFHRYADLYRIYSLLKSINIFKCIKNSEDQKKLDELLFLYRKAVFFWTINGVVDPKGKKVDWQMNAFSKETDIHLREYEKIESILTECAIEEILNQCIELDAIVKEAKKDIMSDMNLEKPIDNYKKEKYIFKYMYYYLLPKYIEDDEARIIINKASEEMLEKLIPFIDEKDLFEIITTLEEFLKQKERKPKV